MIAAPAVSLAMVFMVSNLSVVFVIEAMSHPCAYSQQLVSHFPAGVAQRAAQPAVCRNRSRDVDDSAMRHRSRNRLISIRGTAKVFRPPAGGRHECARC